MFFIRLRTFSPGVSQPRLALDFTLSKGINLSLTPGPTDLTAPQLTPLVQTVCVSLLCFTLHVDTVIFM